VIFCSLSLYARDR